MSKMDDTRETGQVTVYTPLGEGRVVYELPDSTIVVEFPWGGGHIFHPGELLVKIGNMRERRRLQEDPLWE